MSDESRWIHPYLAEDIRTRLLEADVPMNVAADIDQLLTEGPKDLNPDLTPRKGMP